MFLVTLLRNVLLLVVPLSLLLTTYLYTYPVFHSCAFPAPEHDSTFAFHNTLRQHTPLLSHDTSAVAPFRLLALGDPQLEGDTSIDPSALSFTNFAKLKKDFFQRDGTKLKPLPWIRACLHDLVDFTFDDIPRALEVYRKRLDHIGNDYYLGHIYRRLHWWTNPTHTTVLGDLVGSQWINDQEFENRGMRFWNRVFRHAERVPDEVTSQTWTESQDMEILGEDAATWKKRIINVAGNHDIGYAGDLTPERMNRFVRMFGKVNYELRFRLPLNSSAAETSEVPPELRIVVLNDMNLDTPACSKELQDETYTFLNSIITTSHEVDRMALFTLVLTHIPLYKPAGVCVDGPLFDFHKEEWGSGIREQNHLSLDASKGFLEGIFGMSGSATAEGGGVGRRGLIMNGHDHEGCDIYHFINQTSTRLAMAEYDEVVSKDSLAAFLLETPSSPEWQAIRLREAEAANIISQPGLPGLQEATVRSMMGDYGGNAGLLSLWFDHDAWEWKHEFVNCALGTQHIWWIVHITDFIVAILVVVWVVLRGIEQIIDQCISSRSRATAPESPGSQLNGAIAYTQERSKAELNSRDPGHLPDRIATNDQLTAGSGKRSLRKKKSKLNLNGGHKGSSLAVFQA
ncbi:Protein TED1 [Phlyctema vagabunda]|uniref:Protein TED1 n=1 Tax=Phlyctema vagabunda TaxID=108571 RepID=A0ABR4PFW9_9HELO